MTSMIVSRRPASQARWLDRMGPNRCLLRGPAYRRAKRLLDVVLVIMVLPLLIPVLGVCALLIKLDSARGPIFFAQIRAGEGGRPFRMLKLRTMVPNAAELKQQLAHLNELQLPDFKITNDPRVTRVGRVLRKTSLDELPQFLNVLRGEMSLVGPRPTSFKIGTYALWQTARLDVKPGMTGLWQVMGRGTMEFADRSRLDIAYVERRCLGLDVQVLLRTVPAVLLRKGAH